jgi:lysophospholipase L1-like esterase
LPIAKLDALRRLTAALALAAVALPACGGDHDDPTTAVQPPPATELVASLGDSITAGTPRWDPNPGIRAQIGSQLDRRSQYGYWAERHLPGTSFRNCGAPGERTDEIARRLDSCTRGADALIVQGGVNDLAAGIEPTEAAANLRSMVRAGKRRGLDVAIVELLPWNGGYPDAAGEIRELNRLIGRIARTEGAKLIRWYRVLEDPARPGRMRLHLTSDNAHPSIEGYRLLGEAVELP